MKHEKGRKLSCSLIIRYRFQGYLSESEINIVNWRGTVNYIYSRESYLGKAKKVGFLQPLLSNFVFTNQLGKKEKDESDHKSKHRKKVNCSTQSELQYAK